MDLDDEDDESEEEFAERTKIKGVEDFWDAIYQGENGQTSLRIWIDTPIFYWLQELDGHLTSPGGNPGDRINSLLQKEFERSKKQK